MGNRRNQTGKTEVYPFWYMEDIRNMMDYWCDKLHPYDITTVDKLQGIFSRSDRSITIHYVGIARKDEIKLYNDM